MKRGLIRTVIFSHGKESGPWGSKITAMAQTCRELGVEVDSIDYQGIDDLAARVAKLIDAARTHVSPLVLVGSSMGGHVSAAAAQVLQPAGLFLLAPAFYMPGFEAATPQQVSCPVAIVHGWGDAVVPVEHSIRWAREHKAALHVIDSDHRLQDAIPMLNSLLQHFIRELG